MTAKRYLTLESGIDYGVKDTVTGECIFDVDITRVLNEQHEEIIELKEAMKRMMSDMMSRSGV